MSTAVRCNWCGLEIEPGQAVYDSLLYGIWCSTECASNYRIWYWRIKLEEES